MAMGSERVLLRLLEAGLALALASEWVLMAEERFRLALRPWPWP